MNQVVHFEIPADDMEAAKECYSIFGWDLIDMPEMGHIGVRTTPVDENHMPRHPGVINGGMMKRTDKAPVIAIQVDSVATFIEKAVAKGGSSSCLKSKFRTWVTTLISPTTKVMS